MCACPAVNGAWYLRRQYRTVTADENYGGVTSMEYEDGVVLLPDGRVSRFHGRWVKNPSIDAAKLSDMPPTGDRLALLEGFVERHALS